MKKLILFEGPDCAGKTTLIESIKQEQDEYIHNGLYPSQQAAIDAYMIQFDNFEKRTTDYFTLMDRAHWSEEAYGRVIRDTHMLMGDWQMLEERLNEINALVVLCLPPMNHAVFRWSQRNGLGQEFVTKKDQYMDIYKKYMNLSTKALSNVIVYDYTDPFESLTKIIGYIRS